MRSLVMYQAAQTSSTKPLRQLQSIANGLHPVSKQLLMSLLVQRYLLTAAAAATDRQCRVVASTVGRI